MGHRRFVNRVALELPVAGLGSWTVSAASAVGIESESRPIRARIEGRGATSRQFGGRGSQLSRFLGGPLHEWVS